jgi:hypothetical protein
LETIGYKDSESISKADIALRQLNDALRLFVDERFISSLTLAGAAEEIFARLLEGQGKMPITEISIDLLKSFRKELGLDPEIDHKPKKAFYEYWNWARNSVKHHGKKDSDILEINDCDAAYWMIRRALANAKDMDLNVYMQQEFENWITQKINL